MKENELLKKGDIVFIDEDGCTRTLMEGVCGDIASLRIINRSDVSEILREAGCTGSGEEIDVLLTGSLRSILEKELERIPDLICSAVNKAAREGSIEYSDELRKLLQRNGCEMETCMSCRSCEESHVCCQHGGPASLRKIDWCGDYRNGRKLFLQEQDRMENNLDLPFIWTDESRKPDLEEIVKAAGIYMPAELEGFLEQAAADRQKVILTTREELTLYLD